MPEHRKAEVL
jgi:flavin-binding protein dodecin